MQRSQITSKKENVLQGKIGMKILSYNRINELKLMKQQKNNQAENTNLHQQRRKNLDETVKKNIKAESPKQHQERKKNLDETTKNSIYGENTKQSSKEGKTLMKQLKRISRLKMQNSIKKEGEYKNGEKKSIEEVQGISMVDPSILDTPAYRTKEDDCLKETTVGP